MKPKPPSSLKVPPEWSEEGFTEEKPLGTWKVKRRIPWDWWLHPHFSMDLNLPFSFIYFAYWLMVWEWDDYQTPLWERKIEKFFGISFLPD